MGDGAAQQRLDASMPHPRKRLSAEARRTLIIWAAIQVFGKQNYHTATTADIAALAQTSQANLFKHFPTKRDLYLAALAGIVKRLIRRWDLAVVDAANPFQAFVALSQTQQTLMNSPHYQADFRLLYLAAAETNDPHITTALRQHYETLVGYLVELVKRAQQAHQLRPDVDPTVAAWQVLSLFQQQLLQRLIDNHSFSQTKQHELRQAYLRAVGFKERLITQATLTLR